MGNLIEEASYSVGMSIGQSLENQNLENINLDEFVKGIKDAFDKKMNFSPQEANEKIQAYLTEVSQQKFAVNLKEGEAFLAENSSKENIVTLDSGLQYEVIDEGHGAKPTESSNVTVHYHGTLIDGTVFDSSVSRGEPATFGVNQVIKGWTEALQLMPQGSKWRLFIPQDLAYGANPHPGGPIQPYSALIFDVELISVN